MNATLTRAQASLLVSCAKCAGVLSSADYDRAVAFGNPRSTIAGFTALVDKGLGKFHGDRWLVTDEGAAAARDVLSRFASAAHLPASVKV